MSEQTRTTSADCAGPTRHAQRLFRWGLGGSVAYILILAAYSWHEWQHMKAMEPQDFATFLSGVFAPLAFLWLVLGFRQQGDELQNSARALWLQGEELRNSVEQQRQLVEVSREQLQNEIHRKASDDERADRLTQPHLRLTTYWSNHISSRIILNDPVDLSTISLAVGIQVAQNECENARLYVGGALVQTMSRILPNESISSIVKDISGEYVGQVDIALRYVDRNGSLREQTFQVQILTEKNISGRPKISPSKRPSIISKPLSLQS